MSNGESVTRWLHGVKAGDSADIARLWDRYFQRLVRLAGAKLPGHCRRAFDEEDVALSAFQSFCDRAGRGQFPQLSGRDDLWRLLATLTVRKAAAHDAPPDPPEAGRGPGAGRVGVCSAGRSDRSSRRNRRDPEPGTDSRMTPLGLPTLSTILINRLTDPTLKDYRPAQAQRRIL